MFLIGKELSDGIREILAEGGSRCAVAFVGKEAEEIVLPGTKIICNLMSGATNPWTIEALMKPENENCEIRKLDDLHAKVYLGKDRAIVGSANLSANGLGYEPVSGTGGWQEAGYQVTRKGDLEEIAEWFEKKWKAADEISAKDIKKASVRWKLRQRFRATNYSYEDYVKNGGRKIMLAWAWGDGPWEVDDAGKSAAVEAGNKTETDIRNYIWNSIDITVEDKLLFKEGTWTIWFEVQDGKVPKGEIQWFQCGRFIDKAYRHEGQRKKRAVVARSPVEAPEPFPLTQDFRKDFAKRMEAFIRKHEDKIYPHFPPGFYKSNQAYFVLQNFMKLPLP